MRQWINLIYFLGIFLIQSLTNAQVHHINIEPEKPVASIQSSMWGIFFEDINFSADGGLYAELVKNRSFEFPNPMMGWKEIKRSGAEGIARIVNADNDSHKSSHHVQFSVDAPIGAFGLENEGFRGMGIRKNEQYNFSINVKKDDGDLRLIIELENEAGKKLGTASLSGFTNQWKKYRISFMATDTALRGHINILFKGKGKLSADMVSLFPEHTWKRRPNGLRADLVQLLSELKPGFIRFPGGCIVEGRDLANRYQWKNTIGLPEYRKLTLNRWNIEFPKRSAPDYYQTFGLGFFEYFQLCEDLGAEPLPIINCGMACQFNSRELVPLSELDPYLKDALDLIEFANGSIDSKWGSIRAGMGHPGRFHLKFLGIGNEQWDQQYIDRYKQFAKIIKQHYPNLKLVSAAGPSPEGKRFDFAWKELRKLSADIIDEHYYQNPEWFFKNAGRYDHYDRTGPKVFAGEYAAHGEEQPEPESKNTWISALSEAAFMTGLERNADVVYMASYAPLLAHVDAWQWRPDLIWFNNLTAVRTPNYYIQQLFSIYKGKEVIPILENGYPLEGRDSLYASATLNKKKGEVIIKLVNSAAREQQVSCNLDQASIKGNLRMESVSSKDFYSFNSIKCPNKVHPQKQLLIHKSQLLKLGLLPESLNVITIPYKSK